MANVRQSEISGIGVDLEGFPGQPGTLAGYKLNAYGQTTNRAGTSVADQECGTVTIGALGAGASTTITVNNALITAASLLFVQPINVLPNNTPGRGVVASPHAPAAGSCVVDVTSLQAIGAGDYELHYWVRN